MKRILCLLLLSLSMPLLAQNSPSPERFQVTDIRVEGLQRVSAGTVFAALPIQVGDVVSQRTLGDATRSLFRTGLFGNIEIGRDGGVLVIALSELPAISEINIDGNKAIKTEDLMRSLADNGLAEGQILKRATLEGMAQSLAREYVKQGRYGASVDTEVIDLPNNQVRLNINVDEGREARIKHINIVGNEAFDDEELLDLFEIQTTGWLSWLSGNDKYASEKLTGDLERLESYYRDRGYLEFNIDSAPVSISPDREAVYITINITEGDVYTVNEVNLAGDPVLSEEEIRRYIVIRPGQTFSQYLMTTSSEYVTQRLGNEGYTFAEARGIPEPNEEDKTVDITMYIDPGQRAYVRRIEFRGNTQTADEVLRREMRQMEGASASTAMIEQSKVRLERLGYFREVEVETTEVPGTSDQIDVTYTVEEQPNRTMNFQVGYSQGFGAVIGTSFTDQNWFGTGKRVEFGINKNVYQTSVNFGYTDPYFTEDGVSRGFSVFYQETDYEEFNVSASKTDRYGASVNFGYPLSEVSRIGFGFGYTHLTLSEDDYLSQEYLTTPRLFSGFPNQQYVDQSEWTEYLEFVSDPDNDPADFAFNPVPVSEGDPVLGTTPSGFIDLNGDEFDWLNTRLSWVRSTLNRGVLPTRGAHQQLSLDVALPGGDLEFFKLRYEGQVFQPLTDSLTLRLRTELGYADSYGDLTDVPPFEHFYAGGFGTVRGFERNTLGPRSSPARRLNYEFVDTDGDGERELTYFRCDEAGAPYCSADELGTLADQVVGRYDRAAGGNVLITASAEILFPLPFVKDQRSVQSAFFIDAGNVFDTNCTEGQFNCVEDITFDGLSASAGIGITWVSGMGPLTFSIARPLQQQEFDEEEFFQFSLGTSF
ncbi:outer membrane protein assembly factor BamA [Gilvimarinus sp. F26214L]|uniref:outer membrane protein assembly factor BamA n=1 Tax=Gilvimarinus sp. DZF01 TaxID=3461371 RepID=UPI0040467B48